MTREEAFKLEEGDKVVTIFSDKQVFEVTRNEIKARIYPDYVYKPDIVDNHDKWNRAPVSLWDRVIEWWLKS
jgi:hypothetical protein